MARIIEKEPLLRDNANRYNRIFEAVHETLSAEATTFDATATTTFTKDRIEPHRADPKTPRNWPCPCGSGRKFKHCCLRA